MPNSLLDHVTAQLLDQDAKLLAHTKVPIVTVSASFRDEVEKEHHLEDGKNHADIVFSRAHYSMAVAIAVAAWGDDTADPNKAWLIDPTNYVTHDDWRKLSLTETVGRLMARQPILGWVKQTFIDRKARQHKLPYTDAITAPLLTLVQDVQRPILSLHDQTGNLLAPTGKKIVQVVTDPFVRPQYVQNADLPNMKFCVFDENTRTEFFEVAAAMGKKVDPSKVVVTGPPIDPRLLDARNHKTPTSWQRRPLRILLTTGGLGTNKTELRQILEQLLPLIKSHQEFQIVYNAGTNQDHVRMVKELAAKFNVKVAPPEAKLAPLRILSADDVVNANNLLLLYGLPWADVTITKPSGDMAYDAAAAGCALLLLQPWGDWEKSVEAVFRQNGLARRANPQSIVSQLNFLMSPNGKEDPWLEQAMKKAQELPPHFLRGAFNILNVVKNF